jgi:hypothetical protein
MVNVSSRPLSDDDSYASFDELVFQQLRKSVKRKERRDPVAHALEQAENARFKANDEFSEEEQGIVDIGMAAAHAEQVRCFDLDPAHFVPDRRTEKKVKQSTVDRREGHRLGLFHFCLRRGDFYSALYLAGRTPRGGASVKSSTAAEYVLYKTGHRGTFLMSPTSELEPLLDIFDEPFECTGAWNCKSNIQGYKASLGYFHSIDTANGEYKEQCDACVKDHDRDHSAWRVGCTPHKYAVRTDS